MGCRRDTGLNSLHKTCCENSRSSFPNMEHFNWDGRIPPGTNLPPEAALQGGVGASLPTPSHLDLTPACRATSPRPRTGSSAHSWRRQGFGKPSLAPMERLPCPHISEERPGLLSPCSSPALLRQVAAAEQRAAMGLGA